MSDLFSALRGDDDADDDGTLALGGGSFGGGSAEPASRPRSPLAVRMRPRSLDEVVGQQHLLGPGSPLQMLAAGGSAGGAAGPASVMLWGPPGTGKTTLAHVIARGPGRKFVELSAITAGVKDVRRVMDQALNDRDLHGRTTVLFLDEIHRFNKAQQDALLPGVENRWVVLIAATTENPSFSVVAPLLSRSILLTLQPLTNADIQDLLERAVEDPRGLDKLVTVTDDALDHLVRLAAGDARRGLTTLEAAAGVALSELATDSGDEPVVIDLAIAERAIDAAAVRYDRAGDQHYDIISAFIKSVRGSDVDAALHYLARMLEAGEDPRFISRRIMISAAEDVGMADPTALQTAVAAAQAVALIGMPEAGSSWPRPWCMWPPHPSPMPPTTVLMQQSPMCELARAPQCRRRCAMPTMPVPPVWDTARATFTPTMPPIPLPRSSTRRMTWWARTTTRQRPTGMNAISVHGSPGCGRSFAARQMARHPRRADGKAQQQRG